MCVCVCACGCAGVPIMYVTSHKYAIERMPDAITGTYVRAYPPQTPAHLMRIYTPVCVCVQLCRLLKSSPLSSPRRKAESDSMHDVCRSCIRVCVWLCIDLERGTLCRLVSYRRHIYISFSSRETNVQMLVGSSRHTHACGTHAYTRTHTHAQREQSHHPQTSGGTSASSASPGSAVALPPSLVRLFSLSLNSISSPIPPRCFLTTCRDTAPPTPLPLFR